MRTYGDGTAVTATAFGGGMATTAAVCVATATAASGDMARLRHDVLLLTLCLHDLPLGNSGVFHLQGLRPGPCNLGRRVPDTAQTTMAGIRGELSNYAFSTNGKFFGLAEFA